MNRLKRWLAMVLAISLVTTSCVTFAEEETPLVTEITPAEEIVLPDEGEGESEAPAENTAPTSITLSETTAQLTVGGTLRLAAILNECAGECTVTWTSSDEGVATVENGVVTGISAGEATITAAVGEISAQCVVTVRQPAPTSITLSETAAQLTVGGTLRLAAILNECAGECTVTWTSSDETVATVENGVVTGISAGEATITAAVGEISAQCVVTVRQPLTALTLSETVATLYLNETLTLIAEGNEGAEICEIVWSTSDASVATVENGVVTAVGAGEAVITASCGEISAQCAVTVYAPLSELTVTPASAVLCVGDELALTASANAGAQLPAGLTWTSSNTAVATVNADGVVTAVAPGTAKITLTGAGYAAECSVDVRIPLQVGDHAGMVYTGESIPLTYSYNVPEIEQIASAVWSVDNPAVATIDAATGVLTGVSKGTVRATITVTGANGGVYTAFTDVVVKVRLTGISLSTLTLDMVPGQWSTITATLMPVGAEGAVVWTSSDERVATVSAAGAVHAVGEGRTTITATCGTFLAVCTVIVTVPVEGVDLYSDAMVLYVGQKGTIRYNVRPANATDKTISWISGDNSIATVDDNGVVTALRAGECVISGVTSNDISFSVPVKVVAKGQAVTSIKLNSTSKTISRTQTFQLKATVSPSKAADKSVTWASQNPAVATVDATGKVTGVGVGTTTILAVSSSGLYKTCKVTVNPLKVSSVKLNTANKTLYNGQTLQLTATLAPMNADDLTLTWSSSKTSVVTVDANGLVTAHKSGTAYIYCKAVGGASARCKVTVKNIAPVMNVTKLSIAAEETYQVSVTYKPVTEQDMGLIWYSSRTSVATVDETGKITAVGKGSATVYCKTKYGVTDSVAVTVKAPSPVMDMTKKTITSGDSFAIRVTSNPHTDRDLGLTWSSNKVSVATVDANGVVTGHKSGTAKITVRTKYGTTDSMTVTVKAVSPVMNVTKINLAAEETYQVSVTYKPATGHDMGLTWYSSKASVADVDQNGRITATGKGTAKIYCKTKYGMSDYVTVTVKAPSPVLNITQKTVYTGTTLQLNVSKYNPTTTHDMALTWTSSKQTVATVDQNGLVTAVKSGTAKITVRTQYGTTATATITVKASTPVMQGTSYTLDVGATLTVPVTFTPVAQANPALRWSTANSSVATVNSQGLITAIGPDNTVITVQTPDGKKDTCKIIVNPLKVASVTLSQSYGDFAAGGQYAITADVQPVNAGNKELNWASSNPAVATVDNNGTVTARAAGTATITATAKDGSGVSGSIDITVKTVTITSFALDVESVQVAVGETHQVNMTLDAQLDTIVPLWSSDNARVARVDENGLITGVGSGITMVRCRIGGEVRSVKVIVPVVNGSYRVLIAGQYTDANVSGYLNFAENGLQGVDTAFDLANVYGDRYQITRLNNPKKGTLLSTIDSFFADSGENDISVVYLMSHGLNVKGQYRWMISGTNGSRYNDDDYVTEAELTGRISNINGKVLVVIVSCYSGQYLNNYCTEQAAESLSGVVSNINGSRPDGQGINIITSQVGNINSPYTNFPTQVSYDFFNIAFNMALGYDQLTGEILTSLPADADGDGAVSMQELAQYLSVAMPQMLQQHLNQYGSGSVNNTPQQNVQYYLTTPNEVVYSRVMARLMERVRGNAK